MGDVPAPRDTNGDGVAELVVWRRSTGTWFHLMRLPWLGNIVGTYTWGAGGDVPV